MCSTQLPWPCHAFSLAFLTFWVSHVICTSLLVHPPLQINRSECVLLPTIAMAMSHVWLSHVTPDNLISKQSPSERSRSIEIKSHEKHIHESYHAHKPDNVTHVNESCYKYQWVMSHMNESCHVWMSHVTYGWVMSHMNASCHIRMSHVTHMNQSYHT